MRLVLAGSTAAANVGLCGQHQFELLASNPKQHAAIRHMGCHHRQHQMWLPAIRSCDSYQQQPQLLQYQNLCPTTACLLEKKLRILLQLRGQRFCRQAQLGIGRPAGGLCYSVWAAEDVSKRICSRAVQGQGATCYADFERGRCSPNLGRNQVCAGTHLCAAPASLCSRLPAAKAAREHRPLSCCRCPPAAAAAPLVAASAVEARRPTSYHRCC